MSLFDRLFSKRKPNDRVEAESLEARSSNAREAAPADAVDPETRPEDELRSEPAGASETASAVQPLGAEAPLTVSADGGLAILSDREKIRVLENSRFTWRQIYQREGDLEFRYAYEIVPRSKGAPIWGCRYRIHDRVFEDLSFMKGRTLETHPNGYEIRRYPNGVRFLRSSEEIPIFDSGDREWDFVAHSAVYCDRDGVNLIFCRHGDSIPKIQVYIGLTRAFPGFTEWLEKLGCADRVAQVDEGSPAKP